MIDTRELRLGNWVEIFNNPYKVEAINTQFIEAIGYGRCWLKDLNPVRLTSDTLIKNGWEPDNKENCLDKFDDGYITLYQAGPNTFDIWLDDDKNLPMHIHYVHEFQNILSVLGYGDLDIKL